MSSVRENPPSPPHVSIDTPARERIRSRLEFLYGADRAAYLAGRVDRILEIHRQLRSRCIDGPYWTHRDIVLISYGDSIQSPGATPLQTLRTFLSRHLAQEFSMVSRAEIPPRLAPYPTLVGTATTGQSNSSAGRSPHGSRWTAATPRVPRSS